MFTQKAYINLEWFAGMCLLRVCYVYVWKAIIRYTNIVKRGQNSSRWHMIIWLIYFRINLIYLFE